MQIDVLAHQAHQLPVLFGEQILTSHSNSEIKRLLIMGHIDRRLQVRADQHEEEIAELIDVHCIVCHQLVDAVKEVVEDVFQSFLELFLLIVLEVLGKEVTHDPAKLGLAHWAEVKVEEHILVENVSVLLEHLYLLYLAVVHYDH